MAQRTGDKEYVTKEVKYEHNKSIARCLNVVYKAKAEVSFMKTLMHAFLGLILAGFVCITLTSIGIVPNFITYFIIILATMLGCVLPDMIEPPETPLHRGKFHCKDTFEWIIILTVMTLPVFLLANFFFPGNILLPAPFFLCFGYFLHLLFDGATKAGLPGYHLGNHLGPKRKITEKQILYIKDFDPSIDADKLRNMSTIDGMKLIDELKLKRGY